MNWENFLGWQFGMTLLAVLGLGIWGYFNIKRSRERRGEHGHISHPPPDSDTPQLRDRPP